MSNFLPRATVALLVTALVAGCSSGSDIADDSVAGSADAPSGSVQATTTESVSTDPTTTTTTTTTSTTTTTTAPTTDLPQTLGLTGDLTPSPDPDVARDGDFYYVYLTGPGITVKRSADLVHWEEIESVFADPIPAWMNEYPWIVPGEEGGLGAPDVEFFGGRWHLYYHSHQFATNNAITGHASNVTLDPDNPDYEWIDDGLVMSSSAETDTHSVLDANALVDEQGVPWLSFGSFWDGIQLVELDPTTGAPVLDAPFTKLAARDPWVLGVEASSIAFHDGFWYLFVSWGFCCQGVDTQYEIRVGRSADIDGPYLDVTGAPMLDNGGSLLLGAYGDRVRGPGSGDVLVSAEESLLVHHWYDVENDGEVTLGVRPLLWAPDGWPIAADTGFEVAADGEADDAAVAGVWSVSQYVEEQSATVELLDGGSLGGGAGSWTFDAASGAVTINAECFGLVGTIHTFVVGADLATGFGHSDSPFPVRAVRTDDRATC